MYAIEARGLVKSFGGVMAVDGVDLLVEEGDVVGLLGPNGAGKTTTLMMLLGITTPDAGTISLLGHPLPAQRVAALARTNFTASYVGMPDRIRVREVLDVFAGIYEVPRERIHAVVELFGLQPFEKRFATQLSSGQKTLLGLAKAMLNEPDLLILDEPTASLDPEVATRIRASLMEVHRERRFTLLITSHNMSEIERLCRRVVFVANGRVVADGSPAEIVSRYGAEDLEGTFLAIAAGGRATHGEGSITPGMGGEVGR
jgi:ABC-2 type transport system ATP-binding protein